MLKQINWRYAIGEVIIVIIGITLAFALNNWGANFKKQQAKQKYLESLIVDLDNEMEHLKGNMQQFESNIAAINQMFPYFAGKQEGVDTIIQKVFNLGNIVPLYANS